MADTKISALTGASAAADANEFAINEAGASKKLTALQVKTYANTAPVFAAGSASANTWPKITTGTLLTAAEAGTWEFENGALYWTPNASNRGTVRVEHWIRQASSRVLTNSTAEQAIFNSVTNGTLNLPTGVYLFRCILYVTGMSTATGNMAFDILAAGSATITAIIFHQFGIDATNPGTATNQAGSWSISQQGAASCVTAAVGASIAVEIFGTFDITSAGTIVPSLSLVTAAAATLAAGSFFICNRIGATGATAVGDWT